MKRYFFTSILLFFFSFVYAQRFSPEEYRQHLESYISEQAGLTKDEASRFYPLYQEMKDKQRVLFREVRTITHRTNIANTNEATFRQLNERICELNLNIDKLEQDYLAKFRQIISDKKYFLVKRAEASFQNIELRKAHNREKK